jgi:acetylornithine/succinyldiaminopimelate/putrescine aminotransferase
VSWAAGAAAFAEHVKPLLAARLRAIGLDVAYHRARGDRLVRRDERGADLEVLDMIGGFGASLFGHNHPALVARAVDLLRREVPIQAQASLRPATGLLGQRLAARAERAAGRPFMAHFANSGAEAVEAAIKHAEMERRRRVDEILARLGNQQHEVRRRLREHSAHLPEALFARAARLFGLARIDGVDELFLRLYHRALDALDRPPLFLAVEGAFHGKTSGSLKLTHRAEYQAPWRSIGPATRFLAVDRPEALDEALAAATVGWVDLAIGPTGAVELTPRELVNVTACFVEPIQGEGGVRAIAPATLRALRAAADRHGFPLVFDEIQSGMGRTGRFFAAEHAGVAGDYYLLSKALGGGIAKISALLVARDRYLEEFGYLHTSTFADDDLSSEIALAALDLLEADGEALMRRCGETGEWFLARLRDLMARHPDQIRDVRGSGLLIGVELATQEDSPSPFIRLLGEQELLGFMVSGWFLHEEGIRIAPTLSARATIRLEPSAYVERADLERVCAALDRLAHILRRGDAYALVRFAVGRAGEAAAPRPLSVRPRPLPTTDGGAARVGFLTHFLAAGDLLDWDPALCPLTADDCDAFLARTRGLVEPFVAARTGLRSPSGTRVDATVIGLPFTPSQVVEAMRTGGGDWARALIDQGVELARRAGCAVVGFGGFTSILTTTAATSGCPTSRSPPATRSPRRPRSRRPSSPAAGSGSRAACSAWSAPPATSAACSPRSPPTGRTRSSCSAARAPSGACARRPPRSTPAPPAGPAVSPTAAWPARSPTTVSSPARSRSASRCAGAPSSSWVRAPRSGSRPTWPPCAAATSSWPPPTPPVPSCCPSTSIPPPRWSCATSRSRAMSTTGCWATARAPWSSRAAWCGRRSARRSPSRA